MTLGDKLNILVDSYNGLPDLTFSFRHPDGTKYNLLQCRLVTDDGLAHAIVEWQETSRGRKLLNVDTMNNDGASYDEIVDSYTKARGALFNRWASQPGQNQEYPDLVLNKYVGLVNIVGTVYSPYSTVPAHFPLLHKNIVSYNSGFPGLDFQIIFAESACATYCWNDMVDIYLRQNEKILSARPPKQLLTTQINGADGNTIIHSIFDDRKNDTRNKRTPNANFTLKTQQGDDGSCRYYDLEAGQLIAVVRDPIKVAAAMYTDGTNIDNVIHQILQQLGSQTPPSNLGSTVLAGIHIFEVEDRALTLPGQHVPQAELLRV